MSAHTTIGFGLVLLVAFSAVSASKPARAATQPAHRCAPAATEQARKLLIFHVGPDDRITVDNAVKRLAAIRNPANQKQRLDVLEVWGHVYKGQYRMRLIYATVGEECVLMGQEILEYAAL
jgi:hypothetical protein